MSKKFRAREVRHKPIVGVRRWRVTGPSEHIPNGVWKRPGDVTQLLPLVVWVRDDARHVWDGPVVTDPNWNPSEGCGLYAYHVDYEGYHSMLWDPFAIEWDAFGVITHFGECRTGEVGTISSKARVEYLLVSHRASDLSDQLAERYRCDVDNVGEAWEIETAINHLLQKAREVQDGQDRQATT